MLAEVEMNAIFINDITHVTIPAVVVDQKRELAEKAAKRRGQKPKNAKKWAEQLARAITKPND